MEDSQCGGQRGGGGWHRGKIEGNGKLRMRRTEGMEDRPGWKTWGWKTEGMED